MMRVALSRLCFAAAVAGALGGFAPAARAQEESFTLPVERFRPAIDDKGLGTTEGGGIPSHLGFQGGLILNYALNPLVIRNTDDNAVLASIVAHRVAANAMFTIGLFEYVSLGVDLPLTLLQLSGDVGGLDEAVGLGQGLAGIGVGDLRLVPKIRVLREDRHFVSLSLIPSLTLPTAGGLRFGDTVSYDYGGSYLGEGPGAFAFIPEVALSTNIIGIRLAGNLAYRLRNPTRYLGAFDVNPEIVYRAGVGYDLATLAPGMNGLLIWAELFGATPDRNPFNLLRDPDLTGDDAIREDIEARLTNPLEWSAGVRWKTGFGMSVEGGFGAGALPGYGSPDLRVFAGIRYVLDNDDRDGDGIKDSDDKCPDDPEDKDGFQDSDGCPDPDNDGDGLPDSADQCPDAAEDTDGFKDDDGCPDPDNDGDTVKDGEDRCPNEAGDPAQGGCPRPDRDKDGVFDDEDACPEEPGPAERKGCPVPDRDKDGIADDVDACPDVAGVASAQGCPDKDGDGVQDKDDRCPDIPGSPELSGCVDTDGDGIADPDDKCPTEPETINGFEDDDGCPDKGKVVVVVTKEKVEIKDTIYFDTAKDTIQQRSFKLLDQIALILKANPEVKRVRIEGHTDSDGSDDTNLDLSKRRAASVLRYLTDKGVSAKRLESEGYGETKPVAPNNTRTGKAQNRRVEFVILEQG